MQIVHERELYNAMWSGQCNDMRKYGPSTRHELRNLRNIIKDIKFESVLDVGCGTGSLLEIILNINPAAQLSGIDLSDQSIKICKEKFNSDNFWVMDCSREYSNQQFDLILCVDVIEHVKNDQDFLNNLSKMANKSIIIVTLEGRMRKNEISIGHYRNYARGDLEKMATQAGLKVVQKNHWGFPFFSPVYRDILERGRIQNIAYGKYGFWKKLMANLIYLVFSLNVHNRGDIVFLHLQKQ